MLKPALSIRGGEVRTLLAHILMRSYLLNPAVRSCPQHHFVFLGVAFFPQKTCGGIQNYHLVVNKLAASVRIGALGAMG